MKNRSLLLVAALVAGLVPSVVGAQPAQPAIQLLNPSGYTTSPELSAKADSDAAFHFVAVVPSVPPTPFVEFEIESTAGNRVTVEGSPVGTDTWEADHDLTGLTDGQYTIHAILYSQGQQFGQSDSQVVTINNSDLPPPPRAETAEITFPANGGQVGFYTPPGALPRTVVDVQTSEGAQQVRVLYSTSPLGSEPEWVQCGTGSVDEGIARARCTLAEGAVPGQVKAIAAVANLTPPPAPAQVSGDDSGDAHRVTPYVSTPRRVAISPEATKQEIGTCLPLTAVVTDQLARPVAGANVDVHATGPNDNLRFGSISNTTNAFQAPDKGPHGTENALRCSDNTSSGQQGDTNRVPGADEKHIESTAATAGASNNSGGFTFALRSATAGGTQIVAWSDDNDDDAQDVSEASGGARVGWGEDPPQPTSEIFLTPASSSQSVGDCQRLVLTVRSGGNPVSGGNADIHANGAETSFCTVSGGSTLRQPGEGDHVAGSHTDGTKHAEGELNSTGQLIFGVTSSSEGEVVVEGWHDVTDDDVAASGEPIATARVAYTSNGDRDISLNANRKRVPKGSKVRLSGSIDGSEACANRASVRLKARRPGGKFRTIKTKLTNNNGAYRFSLTVKKTKDYRTIAPKKGVCKKARSEIVRVKARG